MVWSITTTTSKTSGHGQSEQLLVIENPYAPECRLMVDTSWVNPDIQKRFADYVCDLLNHAEQDGRGML